MLSAIAATMLVLVPFATDDSPADKKTQVQVIEIREVRGRDLRSTTTQPQSGSAQPARPSRLTVTIELAGKAAGKAVRYGHVHVAKAEYEPSKALKVREGVGTDMHPHDRFVDVDREAMYFWEKEKPKDRIRVDLQFEPAPRSAKAIKTLSGTLKLFTVESRKQATIADILSKKGATLEDELLKSAGLSVKVVRAESKRITIEITGKTDDLLDVALTTAQGKLIDVAMMVSSATVASGTTVLRSLEPWSAVPTDARLVLTVALGAQTVEVPFSFTNVPLP